MSDGEFSRPRRSHAASLAACLLLIGGCGGAQNDEPTGPKAERVILITCDTLRADRLGAYNGNARLTPVLDRFARRSVVFDAAYSSSSRTSASVSSMMTGRLPDELGMSSNTVLMSTDAETVAEVVSAHGIPTAAVVSNWVLRRRKQRVDGFVQGFDTYDDRMTKAEANRDDFLERVARGTTNAALRWLEQRPGDRFFLWVHYQDPHGPYTPPRAFLDQLDNSSQPIGPGPEATLDVGTNQVGKGDIPKYQVLGEEREASYYRQRYEAEIAYFDRELGRLFDALEASDLIDDALIVFTTDHGESLGEHDYWFSHGQTVYRDLVRVPFIVHYPEGATRPRGEMVLGFERVGALVGHLDVLATVAAAFALPAPKTHGVSLFEPIPNGRLIPQHLRRPDEDRRWEGLTDARWRLIKQPDGVFLYDLSTDPGEEINLAESNPEQVRKLEERYLEMLAHLPPVGAQATPDELTPDDENAMDALGYGGGD